MDKQAFREELTHLINRHSVENGSNTPDFLLAEYLVGCLNLWDTTVKRREDWYGRSAQLAPYPVPDNTAQAEPTDHPRAFAEWLLDYTPTISVRGAQLAFIFDEPAAAVEANELLWHAINSVKQASAASDNPAPPEPTGATP